MRRRPYIGAEVDGAGPSTMVVEKDVVGHSATVVESDSVGPSPNGLQRLGATRKVAGRMDC